MRYLTWRKHHLHGSFRNAIDKTCMRVASFDCVQGKKWSRDGADAHHVSSLQGIGKQKILSLVGERGIRITNIMGRFFQGG